MVHRLPQCICFGLPFCRWRFELPVLDTPFCLSCCPSKPPCPPYHYIYDHLTHRSQLSAAPYFPITFSLHFYSSASLSSFFFLSHFEENSSHFLLLSRPVPVMSSSSVRYSLSYKKRKPCKNNLTHVSFLSYFPSPFRVAVRVRPLTENEIQHNCNNVVSFTPDQPQITIGQDRSFTFDYAYAPETEQQHVYSTCVTPLLNSFLDGYGMGDARVCKNNSSLYPLFHSYADTTRLS